MYLHTHYVFIYNNRSVSATHTTKFPFIFVITFYLAISFMDGNVGSDECMLSSTKCFTTKTFFYHLFDVYIHIGIVQSELFNIATAILDFNPHSHIRTSTFLNDFFLYLNLKTFSGAPKVPLNIGILCSQCEIHIISG